MKKDASIFKHLFSTSYCRELSDALWKYRNQWIPEQGKKLPAGLTVLDIGAGTCPYRESFSHCTYVTQDFSQNENIEYGNIDIVSDITAIPLPDGYADVVVCSEVLEHVTHPIEAIKEISRLLKPDGRLILSAPLGSCEHQQPYHFYGGYTQFWYKKFFAENDIEIDSLEPNGGLAAHTVEMLWRSRDGIIYNVKKKPLGAILAPIVQIFLFNLPTLLLWKAENIKPISLGTVGYHILAHKKVTRHA